MKESAVRGEYNTHEGDVGLHVSCGMNYQYIILKGRDRTPT